MMCLNMIYLIEANRSNNEFVMTKIELLNNTTPFLLKNLIETGIQIETIHYVGVADYTVNINKNYDSTDESYLYWKNLLKIYLQIEKLKELYD